MKNLVKILLALMLGTAVLFSTVACDVSLNVSESSVDKDDDEEEDEEGKDNDGNGDGDEDDVTINENGEIDPDESDDTVNPGGATVRPYPGSNAKDDEEEEKEEKEEELSVKELIDNTISAMEKAESCEITVDMNNAVSINGESQRQDMSATSTLNFDNDVVVFIESEVPGVSPFDCYIVDSGRNVDVYYYYDTYDSWVKQTGIPKDVAEANDLYQESFEDDQSFVYMKELRYTGSYKKTSSGYLLEGNVKLDKEMLATTGLETVLTTLIGDVATESDIEHITESLSEIYIEMLIDDETFEIKSMFVDLSASGKDLYQAIFDIVAPGEEVEIEVEEYSVSSTYSNYNDVDVVSLPDEAENAVEATIIAY